MNASAVTVTKRLWHWGQSLLQTLAPAAQEDARLGALLPRLAWWLDRVLLRCVEAQARIIRRSTFAPGAAPSRPRAKAASVAASVPAEVAPAEGVAAEGATAEGATAGDTGAGDTGAGDTGARAGRRTRDGARWTPPRMRGWLVLAAKEAGVSPEVLAPLGAALVALIEDAQVRAMLDTTPRLRAPLRALLDALGVAEVPTIVAGAATAAATGAATVSAAPERAAPERATTARATTAAPWRGSAPPGRAPSASRPRPALADVPDRYGLRASA